MQTFLGFIRSDGSVGVRNHVVAIANCSCANGVVMRVCGEVPALTPLIHTDGCSSPGEFERWKKVLVGVCSNPNIHSVILIGVGCETYNARDIAKEIYNRCGKAVFAQIVQEDGGGEAVITRATAEARRFLSEASLCERKRAPFTELALGTQCGGSDALSGISANPVIGRAADWVVQAGGTALLTETAEFFGTEAILASRARTPEAAERIRQMIYDEEAAVRRFMGREASRIIAKGNMEGGITTIQEKALGCIRKGGTTEITGVIEYADPLMGKRGLVIMNGPGYDPASLCGLFASGAQVFLFSTGRGNPLGFPAAPCIKICSNTETHLRMGGDLDINAGVIADSEATIAEVSERCIAYLHNVCEGAQTMPELRRYGGAMCVYKTTPAF